MVRALGPPNQIPPVQPVAPRPGAPGIQRPGAEPPGGPAAPRAEPPGGMQGTNGTDTVRVSQQAVQALNTGPQVVPPNAATEQRVAVVGEPPPPPPLTPERPREEEVNVRAEGPAGPQPPPAAQIPAIMEEFAPGQATGQNTDLLA